MLNATSDTLEITLLGDYGFDHSYDDEGYLDVEDTFDEDDYDDFVDDEFLDDDFRTISTIIIYDNQFIKSIDA